MITKPLNSEPSNLIYVENKQIEPPAPHQISESENSLKQVLVSKGFSRIFKSLNKEIFLDIEIKPTTSLQLIIESSSNGYEFKNFFGEKNFTVNRSAKYHFKLTGNVIFSRINWISGQGEIYLLFTE